MFNERILNPGYVPYPQILNESMDSIASDLIEAYKEGDLGRGLATLGIHSNAVAKICSQEALKLIMKAVYSQYEIFCKQHHEVDNCEQVNNCEKIKEISDRKINPTWSDAYLHDSQDEMEFYTAIENAIKGRMRWKAIEKVDSDIEGMWNPKEQLVKGEG